MGLRSHAISIMSSWISLTSLLVITLLILSLTNSRVDGKKGVKQAETDQGLRETNGQKVLRKEKQLVKKKKKRQRKTGSNQKVKSIKKKSRTRKTKEVGIGD